MVSQAHYGLNPTLSGFRSELNSIQPDLKLFYLNILTELKFSVSHMIFDC